MIAPAQASLQLPAPAPFQRLPARYFGAIHADPPWPFDNYSAKGEGRNPKRHYTTMSLADIAALPVGALAARDCILFIWVVDPLFNRAFDVIEAWGFDYKTVAFTWVKTSVADPTSFPIGTGYWTRGNPETCLLATRGQPTRLSASVRQLIIATRREHSRKPDEAYEAVERLVAGPYLDLFSRQTRPGWTVWGNEAGKFDEAAE